MKGVVFAGGLGVLLSLLATPLFIRYLTRRQFGQFIRQDGPASHHVKRGTPTMGGVIIIVAAVVGWLGTSFVFARIVPDIWQASALKGALSSILATLMWAYACAWSLLLGACWIERWKGRS